MADRNYRSIYIFLFLQISFFILFQAQDPERFAALFHLSRETLFEGEIWRLLTFQFVTSSFFGSVAIGLFVDLLILYIFGSAIEEQFGTGPFLALFALSTLATAAVGLVLGATLLGGYFVELTLLFIYAHMFPDHQFYLMFILPIKVKWIAIVALAFLALGILGRDPGAIAAAGGAAAGFIFYKGTLLAPRKIRSKPSRFEPSPDATGDKRDPTAAANLEVFRRARTMIEEKNIEDAEELISRLEPNIVEGVNVCPPVDYKPEGEDGYCVRCEGFKECTVRYLRTALESEEA